MHHLINQLQIKKYIHANNSDIIMFLAKNYQIKNNGGNLI